MGIYLKAELGLLIGPSDQSYIQLILEPEPPKNLVMARLLYARPRLPLPADIGAEATVAVGAADVVDVATALTRAVDVEEEGITGATNAVDVATALLRAAVIEGEGARRAPITRQSAFVDPTVDFR